MPIVSRPASPIPRASSPMPAQRSILATLFLLLASCATPPPQGDPRPASTPPYSGPLSVEARTATMQGDIGQEILIRNQATVPIVVTSVTLTNCIGIREACVTHFPRVVINPGQERRVLRVRFSQTIAGSYQFSYRVEPAP
jgi:hypothetical protein